MFHDVRWSWRRAKDNGLYLAVSVLQDAYSLLLISVSFGRSVSKDSLTKKIIPMWRFHLLHKSSHSLLIFGLCESRVKVSRKSSRGWNWYLRSALTRRWNRYLQWSIAANEAPGFPWALMILTYWSLASWVNLSGGNRGWLWYLSGVGTTTADRILLSIGTNMLSDASQGLCIILPIISFPSLKWIKAETSLSTDRLWWPDYSTYNILKVLSQFEPISP